MTRRLALILIVSLATSGKADDWLVKGRTYTNVRVIEVNADSVSVTYDGGTGRLPLADLPPDIAKRFTADAKRAQAFAEIERKAEADAIDRLIVRLSGRHHDGMWVNGAWRLIKLPSLAKPPELVAAFGYQKDATVIETRQIEIDEMPYTAIHADIAGAKKIFILQYGSNQSGRGGCWSGREYPAEL